jgi:hypothetical protein
MVFPFFFEKRKERQKNCQTFLYHEKMSHDEQPPLIWFHLFDSDGQPYNGSSVSSVSLPPASGINRFRQAVIDTNPELGNNQLAGAFPSWIQSLSSLEFLHMWGNKFTGIIPAWLGDLPNLKDLSLVLNSFTGPIPANLLNREMFRFDAYLLESTISSGVNQVTTSTSTQTAASTQQSSVNGATSAAGSPTAIPISAPNAAYGIQASLTGFVMLLAVF